MQNSLPDGGGAAIKSPLQVLRNHGLSGAGLQGCLPVCCRCQDYASTAAAWSGFITATELNRPTCSELMHFFAEASDVDPPDLPSFELLLEDADQQLFNRINSNIQHVLHRLLPGSLHLQ